MAQTISPHLAAQSSELLPLVRVHLCEFQLKVNLETWNIICSDIKVAKGFSLLFLATTHLEAQSEKVHVGQAGSGQRSVAKLS